jgi:hypothetical protein
VIVITGPGRSGTSLIAQLYRELGFDPGGDWILKYNAGYEHHDIVQTNGFIIRDLGLTVLADRSSNEMIRRQLRDPDDPPRNKFSWWLGSTLDRLAQRCLGRRAEPLELVPWERFEKVVEARRGALVELSRRFQVAKDPQFCWTLGAWAASGAQIDHVLVCVRNFDAMLDSRFAAGQLLFRSKSAAKNSFIYGLGLCMMAIHDHRLPHSVVRFPDFLNEPARLFEALRFPAPVTFDRFLDALSRTVSAELIHDVR